MKLGWASNSKTPSSTLSDVAGLSDRHKLHCGTFILYFRTTLFVPIEVFFGDLLSRLMIKEINIPGGPKNIRKQPSPLDGFEPEFCGTGMWFVSDALTLVNRSAYIPHDMQLSGSWASFQIRMMEWLSEDMSWINFWFKTNRRPDWTLKRRCKYAETVTDFCQRNYLIVFS